MKLKRIFVFLLFSVLFVLGVMANPVTPEGAKKVAARFLYLYCTNKSLSVADVVACRLKNETTGYYFVRLDPIGWIMVSGDDRLKPVIGFSWHKKLVPSVEWEESAKTWLGSLDNQIIHSLKRDDLGRNAEWDKIFEASYTKASSGIAVDPLIEVEWNQGSGWNRYCPEDPDGPGGHAYVGCVAVAMAQAMSVYQYPPKPRGEHGYNTDNYGYLYINYDNQEAYNWSEMSNTISDEENSRLLYHLAVAVNMSFSATGSGAYTSSTPSVMKTYFGYSPFINFKFRENYDDDEWHSMIIDELVMGHPLIYSGDGNDGEAGHSFNVDGVGADGTYYHLNWGWSGKGNGYYTLDHLVPITSVGTEIGGNFTYNGGAVFGLRPPESGPYDIVLSNNTVLDMQDTGLFVGELEVADELEDNSYTYILKGAYNLITREYGPPKFYIENDSLKTSSIFDYDVSPTEFVRIIVTDKDGKSFTKDFDIEIEKYYYGPTAMSLSENTIEEGKNPGYFVGVIQVEDDIPSNTYSYHCKGGYDAESLTEEESFIVRNDSLFTQRIFNKFEGIIYYLQIELSDENDHLLSEVFEISIIDNLSDGTVVWDNHHSDLKISPNPASAFLRIYISENERAEEDALDIINILGQVCISKTVIHGEIIDVSGLDNGTYMVIVNRENEILCKKLLIVR